MRVVGHPALAPIAGNNPAFGLAPCAPCVLYSWRHWLTLPPLEFTGTCPFPFLFCSSSPRAPDSLLRASVPAVQHSRRGCWSGHLRLPLVRTFCWCSGKDARPARALGRLSLSPSLTARSVALAVTSLPLFVYYSAAALQF